MRCILFRSGGSQIDVALPVRDNGNPPDWLEVDGIHYKCQGRVDAVTGWIFQEKEKPVVNECTPSPFQSFEEVSNAAAGWFDKIPTPPATVADEVSYAFKGLEYHINDGVGEDSPASTSSVQYFKRKNECLARRLVERETEVRRLGEIIDGLQLRRSQWIVDYNESVKREGRLREEIQRIQLRLADAYKNVVTLEVHEEEVARLRGIIAENVRDLNASQRGWIKALAAQEAEIALLKSDLKVGTDLRRQLQAEIDVLLKRAEVTDRTPSPLT